MSEVNAAQGLRLVDALRREGIEPKRVAIFRALMFGDLVCSVPAFRALRHAFPCADISYIGLPWSKAFAERFGAYIDRFIEFPGYPGLPEREFDLREVPRWIERMQHEQFDVLIQMHGSGSIVNNLLGLCGAKHFVGYGEPEDYRPTPNAFMRFPRHATEIGTHLALMDYLGVPLQGDSLEFPLFHADYEALDALPEWSHLHSVDYVCIHPGARYLSRRWPPAMFATVADALAGQGLRIVLTGSPSEAHLTRAVAEAMRAPAIDMTGRTSQGAVAVLLHRSRLLVSNDTGISHVAAALRVPSVVVTLSSDWRRWAPLNTSLHHTLVHPIACSPCGYPICPIGHICADSVTPDEVIAHANELLSTHVLRRNHSLEDTHA